MFKFLKSFAVAVAVFSVFLMTSCDKSDEDYFLNPAFQGTVWQIMQVSDDGETFVDLPQSEIKPTIYFLRNGGFYGGATINRDFICCERGKWKQKGLTVYVDLESSENGGDTHYTLTYLPGNVYIMHMVSGNVDSYFSLGLMGYGLPKSFHTPSGVMTPYKFTQWKEYSWENVVQDFKWDDCSFEEFPWTSYPWWYFPYEYFPSVEYPDEKVWAAFFGIR